MSIITLILVLAVVGFCLWLVVNYIPMPEPFGKVIVAVVVILLVLWIVSALLGDVRMPTLR